LALVQGWVST